MCVFKYIHNMVLILSGIFLIQVSTVFCILEIINKSCRNRLFKNVFCTDGC